MRSTTGQPQRGLDRGYVGVFATRQSLKRRFHAMATAGSPHTRNLGQQHRRNYRLMRCPCCRPEPCDWSKPADCWTPHRTVSRPPRSHSAVLARMETSGMERVGIKLQTALDATAPGDLNYEVAAIGEIPARRCTAGDGAAAGYWWGCGRGAAARPIGEDLGLLVRSPRRIPISLPSPD
jgi:hypothetical protein